MYEYTLENKLTKEIEIIFGRTIAKALERAKLTATEWNVLDAEYID